MDTTFGALLGLVVWLGSSLALAWIAYYFLSLPMRRQERARFFLDLIEQGLSEGRSPETTMIALSQSRDNSLGLRFHLVAAHIEQGLRLGHALEKVPRFLPPQVSAILKTGEEIGDLGKVLPACRQTLGDGLSQTRSGMNYVIVFGLVFMPTAPAVFMVLAVFVFPKFKQITADMETIPPAFASLVFDHATLAAWCLSLAGLTIYALAFMHIGGPRLGRWFQSGFFPIIDWAGCKLPWRRKRILRDFGAMLSILLDATVPEEKAVSLAAASTANLVFQRLVERAARDLKAGHKLPEAIARLDASGEFRWRLANALHSTTGFRSALNGWLEALDAKAFQQQQAVAQAVSTFLVLFNGALIGAMAVCVFQMLIAIIDTANLW